MKEYLLKLYEYNTWANARVLHAIEKQRCNDARVLTLFSHILAAQLLWLHRVQGWPAPEVELWNQYTPAELAHLHERGANGWKNFLSQVTDEQLYRVLQYTNYSGQPFANRILDILAHTVNHASYHRGQIALRMREQGYEPVNTDFITFDRIISGQLQA
ncbi:MAG: diguanylate cyclase [Cyclobacteriaceae bacterium]|nr:MAG: diguanylate cyclase [Cyclobacteriaceae bacterium]